MGHSSYNNCFDKLLYTTQPPGVCNDEYKTPGLKICKALTRTFNQFSTLLYHASQPRVQSLLLTFCSSLAQAALDGIAATHATTRTLRYSHLDWHIFPG
jgi:hypothetical protein